MTAEEQLAALRPNERGAVMDLVEAAGVNVSGWAVRADGTPVQNPKANPAYCYEWTFGKPGEPVVLCVWHQALKVQSDRIVYADSLRALANRLTSWGHDNTYPQSFRSRALEQSRRASRFDFAVQRANHTRQAIRLIVLRGDIPSAVDLGDRAATVDFRRLDASEWQVESYDDDGNFVLVRSQAYVAVSTTPLREVMEVRTAAVAAAEADDVIPDDPGAEQAEPTHAATAEGDQPSENAPEPWIDQFTLLDTPERRLALTSSYERKPEVRQFALHRAQGCCELCGAEGFRTEQGVYLETHHVIPLAEGGPDHPSNVVALCANDHRRAHFAAERDAIRQQLLTRLAGTTSTPHGG